MSEMRDGCPICCPTGRHAVVTQNGLSVSLCLNCGQRFVLHLGGPGRIAYRALAGRRLTGLVIDAPQINQFVVARADASADSVAG